MRKRAKPTIPADAWVIEADENHPDPRVAAKYADENARSFALDSFQRRLKRLLDNPNPLSVGEKTMVRHLRLESERVKADIEAHKEDE